MIYKVPLQNGGEISLQCGIDNIRDDFSGETVLIAVPVSEDKLFCFPSFIQGLKRLIDTTAAKCIVAFAVNSEDKGMIEAITACDIPYILVPAVRPIEAEESYWFECIVLARNALRELALIRGDDWLFFLDADTCVEPNALNRLLSFNLDMASIYYLHRIFLEYEEIATVQVFQAAPQGRTSLLTRIRYEHAKKMMSPIIGAGGGFGACLISSRTIAEIPIQCGFAPLIPLNNPDDDEEGGWLPEDIFFHHDATMAGFVFAQCQNTKSLHFLFESDYPRGYAETGELVTYDEYMEQ